MQLYKKGTDTLLLVLFFIALALGALSYYTTKPHYPTISQTVGTDPSIAKHSPATTHPPVPTHANPADASFTYKGYPIDPECITDFSGFTGNYATTTDLDMCTRPSVFPQLTIDHGGWISAYNWIDGAPCPYGDGEPSDPVYGHDGCGISEYQVLASTTGMFVIKANYSGGGSGDTSFIDILSKNKNLLTTLYTIAGGGDRCAGGIYGASFSNGILYYSKSFDTNNYQNCTPAINFSYDVARNSLQFISITSNNASSTACVEAARPYTNRPLTNTEASNIENVLSGPCVLSE